MRSTLLIYSTAIKAPATPNRPNIRPQDYKIRPSDQEIIRPRDHQTKRLSDQETIRPTRDYQAKIPTDQEIIRPRDHQTKRLSDQETIRPKDYQTKRPPDREIIRPRDHKIRPADHPSDEDVHLFVFHTNLITDLLL